MNKLKIEIGAVITLLTIVVLACVYLINSDAVAEKNANNYTDARIKEHDYRNDLKIDAVLIQVNNIKEKTDETYKYLLKNQ